MCNCCQSFFCGVANALDNLFSCPCGNNGNNGCGCNGNGGIASAVNNLFSGGCGCNGNNNGCGCNGNSRNNNGCGCGCNNNNGCGCNNGFDVYYMQQYALGPFASGCNVCGF